MNVCFRDVDATIFRKFKAEIAHLGMKSGTAITLALQHWLETKAEKKKAGSLLAIKPWDWGTEKDLSKRTDEILYGWKK
jgi:hypothetical protein